ncbi:tRNA (N6-threonylcarbamoyladenosine(37)-N6)-methyltransferase TrmO [Roseiarcaceae bacterium H3SJ34-1]|uniref:tRNA (N6-threonylcarbamoyladenosine(37)-N6)-methyltransferase TrmO n=1 Tax=Terripilifer ovatus TaxID=3032367 RepID=UPI003AB922D3|nr:tRNA (N6-threonylcarbamoyladenosine(37)-N6)-methyltransferase TrmO [Roseiarcaceae bacterium H3SJ34-1]
MATTTEIRPGESTVELPAETDAAIYFIGTIRTPWRTRRECPRRGDLNGPVCTIEIAPPWRAALQGVGGHTHLQILYWMHEARRDLVLQSPRRNGEATGTFSLRSPNRPNPIASSLVVIEAVEADRILVRGLDCIDGTPLIDVKPESCPEWPAAGRESSAKGDAE